MLRRSKPGLRDLPGSAWVSIRLQKLAWLGVGVGLELGLGLGLGLGVGVGLGLVEELAGALREAVDHGLQHLLG